MTGTTQKHQNTSSQSLSHAHGRARTQTQSVTQLNTAVLLSTSSGLHCENTGHISTFLLPLSAAKNTQQKTAPTTGSQSQHSDTHTLNLIGCKHIYLQVEAALSDMTSIEEHNITCIPDLFWEVSVLFLAPLWYGVRAMPMKCGGGWHLKNVAHVCYSDSLFLIISGYSLQKFK